MYARARFFGFSLLAVLFCAFSTPGCGVSEEDCVPDCEGKACGDDGCGASCGTCEEDASCNAAFVCEPLCVASCDGKECGDDGCSGSCGECEADEECSSLYECERICTEEDCAGLCCGHDECGNPCSSSCEDGLVCDPSSCTCRPAPCAVHPPLPSCESTTPAPSTPEGVASWIRSNIQPLECREGPDFEHNIDILARDFDGHTLFLFGEVHGSAELGHVSAAIFDHLVRSGQVRALTMETGMDLTEPMRTYVTTGGGPLVSRYDYDFYSPDSFIVTLIETARALYLDGVEVDIFGIDVPVSLEWANEEIEAIASELSETSQPLVLDSLPPVPQTSHLLPLSYFEAVDDYFQHMQGHYESLCPELGEELCERLQILVAALWCGAFSTSEKYYRSTHGERTAFLRRREPVIEHNLRSRIESPLDRTYVHIGSAHAAKDPTIVFGDPSVSYLLDTSHGPTIDSVYTTTIAYGPGSKIRYGQITELQADPPAISIAMDDAEHTAYWMSTRHPSLDCEANPLSDYTSSFDGFSCRRECGVLYNAFTYIPKLTPERLHRSNWEGGLAARAEMHREVVASITASLF